MNKSNSDFGVLTQLKKYKSQNCSTTEIAKNLNCSPQWVRDLSLVIELMNKSPILSEFILTDRIRLSTFVNSYKEYGNKLIDLLPEITSENKITPSVISRYMANSQLNLVADSKDPLSYALDNYYQETDKESNFKLSNLKDSQITEIKNFWRSLRPNILQGNQVNLGIIDLDSYVKIENLMKDL